MTKKTVVIVGAGVIGTACAYYLARSDWTVTMLDAADFGKACSHGNCGLVVPSHLLPLAVPGAVGKTMKTALRKGSPVYIKPRLSPALWSWLFRFSRRCNHSDMLEAGRARAALLDSSLGLYAQLRENESLDCQWQSHGCLFVYQTQAEMDKYAKTDKLLRDEFSLPASRYDGDAVCELEPALKTGLAGGWLYEMDSHLRPDRLMTSWRAMIEALGVEIREHCKVTGIVQSAGRAVAVKTTGGEIKADAFVIATGAETPLLNRHLGCKIPIQPGKGYSITMPRPDVCPTIPLIFQEHKVVATPMQSGYRLGSTMEFAGYDHTINPARLASLSAGAAHYLNQPVAEPAQETPVQETWYGWRPMTYDGKPIIDRSVAADNVIIAAGHNMLGLSMAPATGKLVQEMLDDVKPHVDPSPYSVRRF